MQAGEREIEALYRALLERDAASWDEAWQYWSPRVAAWVRRHPQYRYTGEDVDYFINRAFEKFWRAVDPQKLGRFENPAQLVQYLKMCVHSAIVDALRSPAPDAGFTATPDDELNDLPAPGPAVEEQVVSRVHRDSLWAAVAVHVRSEEERCLVDAMLVRGLPPREVASRYRGLFGGVEEVYRVKRNLMDRLSRDQRLREFLS